MTRFLRYAVEDSVTTISNKEGLPLKRTFLTTEQKQYILDNYSKEQTRRIANELGLTIKQVNGYANQKGLKKQEGFITIRADNPLSEEQQDFIFKNYAIMSNNQIVSELQISKETLSYFARKHKLVKNNKLLEEKSNLSINERQYILDNYASMPTEEISENIGIDEDKIRCYAFTHGIKKDKEAYFVKGKGENGLSLYQKQFIISNYSTSKTKDIAQELGISESQVFSYATNKKLKKNFESLYKRDNYFNVCLLERQNEKYNPYDFLGKSVEPKLESEKLYKSKYGKYFLNQDYFEVIDNEWKAYWLGFLYADGYVVTRNNKDKKSYTVGLNLKEEDKSHIEKFANSVQTDAPIKTYKTNYKDYEASKIIICNKKFCEDLIDKGCYENKTFLLNFPKLRQDLVRHFIRGYFDGDGGVSVNIEKKTVRVNIVGTYNILKTICDIFHEQIDAIYPKMQTKNKEDTNKVYSIQWGNIFTCKKIYQFLYKDCNIYLERKFKKFDIVYCLE